MTEDGKLMIETIRVLRHRLEQQAQECSISANSWDGSASLLRFVEGVLQRLPSLDALETGDIDAYLTTELEELANLVIALFPTEGFEELATFLRPDAGEDRGGERGANRFH